MLEGVGDCDLTFDFRVLRALCVLTCTEFHKLIHSFHQVSQGTVHL